MPAPPLGLAPVTVDPGSDTGLYYILVGNVGRSLGSRIYAATDGGAQLESNTTWHELKAFVRKRCEVDSAEIYLRGTDPKRAYGWVRVRGKKRFDIALGRYEGIFSGTLLLTIRSPSRRRGVQGPHDYSQREEREPINPRLDVTRRLQAHLTRPIFPRDRPAEGGV